MKNPELAIQDAARTAEQFLVMPLSLSPADQPHGANFAQDLAVHQLTARGAPFVLLEGRLANLILPKGEYPDTIRRGDYAQMGRLANTKAVEAAGLVAKYRKQENLTIADAFAVHGLMSFLASLNRPPTDKVQHSPDRTTYYLTHFAGTFAKQVSSEDLRTSPDPFDIAVGLREVGGRLGRAIGETPEWVTQKFHTLAEQLSIRKHISEAIDAEPSAEVDDVAKLKRNNDALFKELNRLRRYSIKSAVHQDGEVAWSIHDGFDYSAQRAALAAGSEIKVGDWPPNLRMVAVEQLADTERMYLVTSTQAQDKIEREGVGRTIFMDDKGELFADHHAVFSYEDLYADTDKPQNYEVLRQKMLRYFFDLTVPTEVVRQVIDDERRALDNNTPQNDERNPNQVIYADFLVPRIRRLKDFKTIGQMERFETDLPKEETIKKKLELPLHPVEAHRRTLPPGYKPSRAALALAEKLGWELEPGETVVSKHNRGDEKNGIIVHKGKHKKQ